MAEPTITCPKCKNEIKLTESLAAPLVDTIKQDFEKRLAQKDLDLSSREKALTDGQALLAKAKEGVDEQVARQLKTERTKIAAEEAKKARQAASDELERKGKELSDIQEILAKNEAKLAEAQKAHADVLKKQRELDDAKRELELTIEKRVQETSASIREKAQKDAEANLGLRLQESAIKMASMSKTIEELNRKVEQGSQQLQGEALELQLESTLRARFPHDQIEPVPKGEHGGDILQRVSGPAGTSCGTILWESKRTKNWSDGWLAKLRDDQRSAKAEVSVIVSSVLPKGVETFGQIDDVWITHPRAIIPVAFSLRHMLIEVNCARQTGIGQQTKMELVYNYLTGPQFQLRVRAIVEAFSSMQSDLVKEKQVIMKQWEKRQKQIDLVIESTTGMYGDLQGIAGKTLQEIDGLEFKSLEAPHTVSQL